MKRKPLEVLGLAPGADEAAITAAYRKLCMVRHPDRGGSHEAFVELKQAKEEAIKQVDCGSTIIVDDIFSPYYGWSNLRPASGFEERFEEYLRKTYGAEMFRRTHRQASQPKWEDPVRQAWNRCSSTMEENKANQDNKRHDCTACQDTGYIELTKGLSTMRLRCPTCLGKPKGEKK